MISVTWCCRANFVRASAGARPGARRTDRRAARPARHNRPAPAQGQRHAGQAWTTATRKSPASCAASAAERRISGSMPGRRRGAAQDPAGRPRRWRPRAAVAGQLAVGMLGDDGERLLAHASRAAPPRNRCAAPARLRRRERSRRDVPGRLAPKAERPPARSHQPARRPPPRPERHRLHRRRPAGSPRCTVATTLMPASASRRAAANRLTPPASVTDRSSMQTTSGWRASTLSASSVIPSPISFQAVERGDHAFPAAAVHRRDHHI